MRYTNSDIYYVSECDKIVLWSGGVDSTLILYGLLKYSTKEKPVGALAINHYFLDENKIRGENNIRDEFIKNIVEKNGNLFYLTYEELDYASLTNHNTYNEMTQAGAWITQAHGMARKDAKLYWGVLSQDTHIRYLDRMDTTIASLNKLLSKNVSLETPLEYYTKLDALDELFFYNLEDYVWVCEMPIIKDNEVNQCGGRHCKSCQEHIQALLQLRLKNHHDKSMKSRIDRHLEKSFNIKFTKYSDFSYLFHNPLPIVTEDED